ncbi:hypothetical protein PF002_g23357 [Phytophthora fragariae]|uniref:Uncharacterized protein n=1 Tax=Phytophthora fragariae TaxID=53985 RepID=A0A6A3X3F0_9STRA|nr:hypothetical protein PF002_g23357 [Phytophthora fragariae]
MEIKKLVWRDMDSEEEKDELVVALGNAGRGHEALRSCPWWTGPATQCYMSVQQARLPEEAPIQTPDDATFRQLQWIDQQEEAMEQENTNQASHGEYQTVRVIFEGVPIPLRMNVADLRLALGLPSYSLRPPYRAPSNNAIPDPEVNMDDIDHR